MLTELRLRNFKAFGAEAQKVPMSKITLIYGPNSGGKSSIIQSLMLLKQSIEHFDTLPTASRLKAMRELTPKGDYVDLGSFPTVVHRHDTTRELELALSFDHTGRRRGRGRRYGIQLTFVDGNDPSRRDTSFLSRSDTTSGGEGMRTLSSTKMGSSNLSPKWRGGVAFLTLLMTLSLIMKSN